ncbi:hypothetical protein AVEN_215291-1 [Araneus ventricosus]|uniref:Uncharacterized protein n=1 Tax=Araneus ventricosus TaxID=182803 RepID=A0A4Y2VGH5_ARAVE|nr:hypothetical protein AVEN_215291-1 [Araneus ventricosus]
MERCISEIYPLLSEFNWPSGYRVSFRTVNLLSLFQPSGGSASLVKRFGKRVIEDPLSVLKLRLPPTEDVPKAQQIQCVPPSELWTVNNPRGGTNHKNSFYSARNLFKLALTRSREIFLWPCALTAFGDPTYGVTKLTLQAIEMGIWGLFSAYCTCQ